jgi:D-alanine transaminase
MAIDRAESDDTPRRFGSYTTARVSAGRVERVERHVRRLRRDAARLALPPPDATQAEHLLLETARRSFGRGDGIVRVEWSREDDALPALIATSRPLGEDPDRWRACCAETVHPGPEARCGAKFVAVEAYTLARDEIRTRGVHEVLLFDRAGFVVEGAHSNLLVVDEEGRLLTPDPALGAVDGLGLEIVREQHPQIAHGRLRREDLQQARELLAVNAVRGVVPIVLLDDEPVGSGRPGDVSKRLREPFFRPRSG